MRESSGFSLFIPARDPLIGAKGVISSEELLAGLEIFSSGVDTFEVIDIVLPAVLGLILVRESGIEPSGLENVSFIFGFLRHAR